ncbi:MAG: T9SS type A sorting domain-containing protein, partial [Bacteroidales bacterium]|nr:T9SS type A sorting domain-containing protein [Bacteroidales bacterium]
MEIIFFVFIVLFVFSFYLFTVSVTAEDDTTNREYSLTVTRSNVGTTDMMTRDNIRIVPNPAQTQFSVINAGNATITMYNLLGQKVKQLSGKEDNVIIHTQDLPAGMYVLKIERENTLLTKKVQVL